MSKRLSILETSLAKKEAAFDRKINEHFSDVSSANGQPLNDKRNGAATMNRWNKQEDALRTLKLGIEKTKQAIERETSAIANVEGAIIPAALKRMVERGELIQWRKFPNQFFVPGVERARLVWDEKGRRLLANYKGSYQPPAEQWPKFRDVARRALALIDTASKTEAVTP